ncbi:LysR family transcriptional regulator [Cobetia sp. L2A1]|uniref:LysR family transcriptional regulator n=1 Tax=Cobetia sp. L2A1 TaxID=2686360 RepID=UPI00131CBF7A|nr:LysR family transcriptional regulator [Cobetia sp. L2A1]
MEIRWLEDFIVLAKTRHFSRAAEAQNVSQPTFSRRIKLLEEDMGTTLINRQTLPLSLTPSGDEFLRLCEQITERVRTTRERLQAMAQQQASKISLAAPQSLISQFLPQWLDNYQLREQVLPYLRATGWLAADYFHGLDRGECDLAMCYWPQARLDLGFELEHYRYLILGEETFIPVCAPHADGTPRYALPGTRRSPLPFISPHPRAVIATTLTAHLAQIPVQAHLTTMNENIQASNIKELVMQGYGIGWLPLRLAEVEIASGQLVRAGDARWDVPLHIRLYRPREPRHDSVSELWQHLENCLGPASIE